MAREREAANLTKQFIWAALPRDDGRERKVYDNNADSPRRFFLRVSPKGTKSLELAYYLKGRERRITLKTFKEGGDKLDDINLGTVRRQARKLVEEIRDGFDPLGKRSKPNYASLRSADPVGLSEEHRPATERTTQDPAPSLNHRPNTVGELIDLYYHAHVINTASANNTKRYLYQIVAPYLGKVELDYVTRADLIYPIEKFTQRGQPAKARMVKAHLSSMFAWAENKGLIQTNVAHRLPAPKIKHRERVLDYQEIYDFMHGLAAADTSPAMKYAAMLILVTGQRPKEVLGMREEHIRHGIWTIPAQLRRKTDTPHRVPLGPFASYIIEQAITERDAARARREKRKKGENLPDKSDLVFPGRRESLVAVESFDKIIAKQREVLGNHQDPTWGHWRPHDLRRTCRTGLAIIGSSEAVAERIIGHVAKGIVQVYNHHTYDREKLDALTEWENFLLRLFRWEGSIESFHAMVTGWEDPEGDNSIQIRPRIPSLMDDKGVAPPSLHWNDSVD